MRSETVTFVWPGDLHLETADRENYRTAEWMIDEVNRLVRPDFVQFAGDNVQHATPEQFALFLGLCGRLQLPYYPLVGDHDAHHDPSAAAFRGHFGETYGAMSLGGFRFIRLNTMEFKPLGISAEQIAWFRYQVDAALARGEQVVVFQHHYPYQIWEDFSGPGVDEWREIVQTRRIAAIFAGHTHYGQIANDGRNACIATRSIGEPEGGPAGYSLVHLEGDDLALTYRSVEDNGPLVMITHPRDVMLAVSPRHVVSGQDYCEVRVWIEKGEGTESADEAAGRTPAALRVHGRIDGGEKFDLQSAAGGRYRAPLPGQSLAKGEHELSVTVRGADGNASSHVIRFMVDRSGRYTAFPRVRPEVHETRFC